MRTLIVYYSRTGQTRKAVEALARLLDADLGEIHCDRYKNGAVRYLLAGFDSVRGRLPQIRIPSELTDNYDLVVIGSPIWTSHPSLPVRGLLAAGPKMPAQVALLLTHGGHSPPQRAIEELQALLPNPPKAALALQTDDLAEPGLTQMLKPFAARLKAANQS